MRISILRKLFAIAIPLVAAGCGETPSSTDSQAVTASLAPTPELKAAMGLGSANTLEKSRKTKQALSAYRRIDHEYPESPQAKIAAERINALGSK